MTQSMNRVAVFAQLIGTCFDGGTIFHLEKYPIYFKKLIAVKPSLKILF